MYLWIWLCYPDAEQNPTNQSKEARLSLNTRNVLKISEEITTTTAPTPTKNVVTNRSIGIHTYEACYTIHCVKRNESNEVPRRTLPRVFYICLCWFACNKKGAPKTSTFQFSSFACNAIFLLLNIFFLAFHSILASK